MIRKSVSNLTFDAVAKLDDDEIKDAVFSPRVSKRAKKIFDFIHDNANLTTSLGGMDINITGLDKYKLSELAKGYNINLFKYMFAVKWYEEGMSENQARNREKEK